MPMYEYACPCGSHFEEVVPYEDRNFVKCPQCGETATLQMNLGGAMEVNEVVDPLRNKKYPRGTQEMLKDRVMKHRQSDAVAGEFAARNGVAVAERCGYIDKDKKKCI